MGGFLCYAVWIFCYVIPLKQYKYFVNRALCGRQGGERSEEEISVGRESERLVKLKKCFQRWWIVSRFTLTVVGHLSFQPVLL